MFALPLVCLQYIQELLVGVLVVGVPSLDFVQVLNRVVELAGWPRFERWSTGATLVEVAQERGRSLLLESGRKSSWIVREVPVRRQGPCRACKNGRATGIDEAGACEGWHSAGRSTEDDVGAGRLSGGARRCSDCNSVVVVWRDIYPVSLGQERVETLDKGRVSVKEMGNALDDARRVDAVKQPSAPDKEENKEHAHLALKVLHYIQKLIVDIGQFLELVLDCVEIPEGVSDVEGPVDIHGEAGRC